jgi:hypothetical protein
MLAAGVIDSIILILQHVELLDFLKQLLLVLVVFFVIGNILKLVLDIGMQKMADPQDMPDEFDGEDDSPVEEMDAEEHM